MERESLSSKRNPAPGVREAQNTVFVRLLAGHTGTGGGKVGYQNITEERVT